MANDAASLAARQCKRPIIQYSGVSDRQNRPGDRGPRGLAAGPPWSLLGQKLGSKTC